MKGILIKRFDGTAKLVAAEKEDKEFDLVADAEKYVKANDLDVISHGSGSHILGNTIATDFEQRDDTQRYEQSRRQL